MSDICKNIKGSIYQKIPNAYISNNMGSKHTMKKIDSSRKN